MEEIWKEIKNFDGYKISNLGNVKGKRNKLLSLCITQNGYLIVGLLKNKNRYMKLVHRLVAEAFIPNLDNKPTVNHIDGNKHNNCIDNLEWNTNKEQTQNAIKIGLIDNKKRDWSKFAKAGQEVNSKIVCQCDLFENIINKYRSINEASRQTHINHSNISMVCKGYRKTAGGYRWKYFEGDE